MRSRALDFYFDFISPYAYLAAGATRTLAARQGLALHWHPFRLGVAVVKVMGLRPLIETPLKGNYARGDVARLAAVMGLPFAPGDGLPDPLPPAHLFYATSADRRESLACALLEARWAEGRDIGKIEVLESIVEALGLADVSAAEAADSARAREALRHATRMAIARGVFGSPTLAVGDELFWGIDRLWLLEHYLSSGGRYPVLGEVTSRSLGLVKHA